MGLSVEVEYITDMQKVMAVSYTHLDVYKRQVTYCYAAVLNGIKVIGNAQRRAYLILPAVTPVSYTHLLNQR